MMDVVEIPGVGSKYGGGKVFPDDMDNHGAGHRNLKNFIQTRWKSIMKQTVLFVIVYSRT